MTRAQEGTSARAILVGDQIAATITAALEGMSDVDIGGYRLAYSKAGHHGSRFVEVTMVGVNGDYVR